VGGIHRRNARLRASVGYGLTGQPHTVPLAHSVNATALQEILMNDDCLTLTAYFHESQRSGGRFFSDALLELYEQHRVATSIVLRGIGGFGSRRYLRSDRSLSLSEDPPVAVTATDTRTVIEGLLPSLQKGSKRALVTLERARLLRDVTGPVELPDELHEATKLTIYIGRKERTHGIPAYIGVCDLMHRRQLAGASVFLGVDGITHGKRQRARFFSNNTDVPMMIIAVGNGERISRVLPELSALLDQPVITVERVRVCKRDGHLLDRPHALPPTDEHGRLLRQKVTVYTSESDRYNGVPIHRALTQRLWQGQTAQGATILRGLWGFHGEHKPHGDKLFQLSRRVPVVTIIIDTPNNIGEYFDVIDEITQTHGLVTSEMVPALAAVDTDHQRGIRMARHNY
jgi:PII-like signaling protein